MPIIDASESDVIPTLALPSGKEYTPSASLSQVDSKYFLFLGRSPWFDIEALEVEGFVDTFTVEGWLPGEIPLKWNLSCMWRHQYACHEDHLFRLRGESLDDFRHTFCESVMYGLGLLCT